MPKPYPVEFRERLLAAVDRGDMPKTEVARVFGVTYAYVKKLLKQRREEGTIAPRVGRPGPKHKLSSEQLERLRHLVEKNDDATLEMLRTELGAPVCLMTISRALHRLGLTSKRGRPRGKAG